MSLFSRPGAHGRLGVLMLATALYAAVFAHRHLFGSPSDGLAFLYLLPICLVAVELGLRAGFVAGLVALGLFGVWEQFNAIHLGPLAYLTRGVVFVGVGSLCGHISDRMRTTAEQGDRYFDLSSEMLGIFDVHGDPIRLNRRWTEVLGWSTQQIVDMPVAELVHPDDLDHAETMLAETAGRPDCAVEFTTRMLTASGGVRHITWSSSFDEEHRQMYVAAHDVTDKRELEEARREAEQRFRVAFEHSATGMAVVGLTDEHSGRIVEANVELARILGTEREDVLGRSGMLDFAHPEDLPRLRREFAGLVRGEVDALATEMRVVTPSGTVRWVHMTSALLQDENGQPRFRLSQILDIDARKRGEETLRYLADHDPLSGLGNRRRFVAELERELDAQRLRGSRAAVMMIDLDGFKSVNDTAGHAAGDQVIATVGRAFEQRLRSGDTAGRLGGDEFGVLLRRVTGEEAVLVAHDLLRTAAYALDALEEPAACRVTLSIGVAMIEPGVSDTADDLLAHADAAMYRAKAGGGGRVALAVGAEQPV